MQTPGRVVSPHHLTQNVQRGGQSSIQGHANRRLVYKIYIYIFFFFSTLSTSFPRARSTYHHSTTIGGRLRAERHERVYMRPRLQMSHHAARRLGGRRRSRRAVTLWIVADHSRTYATWWRVCTTILYACRAATMRPVDSFMHRYTGWFVKHRARRRFVLFLAAPKKI